MIILLVLSLCFSWVSSLLLFLQQFCEVCFVCMNPQSYKQYSTQSIQNSQTKMSINANTGLPVNSNQNTSRMRRVIILKKVRRCRSKCERNKQKPSEDLYEEEIKSDYQDNVKNNEIDDFCNLPLEKSVSALQRQRYSERRESFSRNEDEKCGNYSRNEDEKCGNYSSNKPINNDERWVKVIIKSKKKVARAKAQKVESKRMPKKCNVGN